MTYTILWKTLRPSFASIKRDIRPTEQSLTRKVTLQMLFDNLKKQSELRVQPGVTPLVSWKTKLENENNK